MDFAKDSPPQTGGANQNTGHEEQRMGKDLPKRPFREAFAESDERFAKSRRFQRHPTESHEFRRHKERGRRGNVSISVMPPQPPSSLPLDLKDSVPSEVEVMKKKERKIYQYGNYPGYYNYRCVTELEDPRLQYFGDTLFKDKAVLDIGCNDGRLTILIAKKLGCKSILGVDIDEGLVSKARKTLDSLKISDLAKNFDDFPISFTLTYGPIPKQVLEKLSLIKSKIPSLAHSSPSSMFVATETQDPSSTQDNIVEQQSLLDKFPHNVIFRRENFVEVEDPNQKFDVVLCLSLTKWVHLNWGDVGLKRLFRKMYASLNKGGILVLEPQPWKSYEKKGNLTEQMKKTMKEIKLKPDMFEEYLQQDVGFQKPTIVHVKSETSDGFSRPLYFFKK